MRPRPEVALSVIKRVEAEARSFDGIPVIGHDFPNVTRKQSNIIPQAVRPTPPQVERLFFQGLAGCFGGAGTQKYGISRPRRELTGIKIECHIPVPFHGTNSDNPTIVGSASLQGGRLEAGWFQRGGNPLIRSSGRCGVLFQHCPMRRINTDSDIRGDANRSSGPMNGDPPGGTAQHGQRERHPADKTGEGA